LITMTSILVLEKVSKRWGPREVLRDVDLVLDEGECCIIYGPSGSGKSTLANIVCGFEKPSSGRVQILHYDLTSLPSWKLHEVRRYIAYSPQRPILDATLTPIEIARLCVRTRRCAYFDEELFHNLEDGFERIASGCAQQLEQGRFNARDPSAGVATWRAQTNVCAFD